MDDFFCERLEHPANNEFGVGHLLSDPQILHPLRRARNRQYDRPANDHHGHKDDQQHLGDHMPHGFAPYACALGLDEAGVMKNRESAGHP